jgi:hypothetical protein
MYMNIYIYMLLCNSMYVCISQPKRPTSSAAAAAESSSTAAASESADFSLARAVGRSGRRAAQQQQQSQLRDLTSAYIASYYWTSGSCNTCNTCKPATQQQQSQVIDLTSSEPEDKEGGGVGGRVSRKENTFSFASGLQPTGAELS